MAKHRVLFVWTGVTGYMGDCWRELSRYGEVSLEIVVADHPSGAAFDRNRVLRDLKVWFVPEDGAAPKGLVRPDVIFAVGWHSPVVRELVTRRDWASVPKVGCLDLPWDGSLRRFAARWVLGPFLRNYDAAYVPGKLAERYAKWLRFPKVYTGLYGTELSRFAVREQAGRGFLFVGRYEPEKNLGLLIRAYRRYRARGGNWPLRCVGAGSEAAALENCEGVENLGFVQPDELAAAFAQSGALVLPSNDEPWGVVLAEAAGAGLPLLTSSACGANSELVRGNGWVFESGDEEGLTELMLRMENLPEQDRIAMGKVGVKLAEPFGVCAWAKRTRSIIDELLNEV